MVVLPSHVRGWLLECSLEYLRIRMLDVSVSSLLKA